MKISESLHLYFITFCTITFGHSQYVVHTTENGELVYLVETLANIDEIVIQSPAVPQETYKVTHALESGVNGLTL